MFVAACRLDEEVNCPRFAVYLLFSYVTVMSVCCIWSSVLACHYNPWNDRFRAKKKRSTNKIVHGHLLTESGTHLGLRIFAQSALLRSHFGYQQSNQPDGKSVSLSRYQDGRPRQTGEQMNK